MERTREDSLIDDRQPVPGRHIKIIAIKTFLFLFIGAFHKYMQGVPSVAERFNCFDICCSVLCTYNGNKKTHTQKHLFIMTKGICYWLRT